MKALRRSAARFRPTVARIDLGRLRANGRLLSRLARRPLLAVVKADAYGHGAVPVARALEAEGVGWFGVALVEEAIELREAGVRGEILLLGGLPSAAAAACLAQRLIPAVFEPRALRALDRAARQRGVRLGVHVKIDTGMARLGVRGEMMGEFLAALARCRSLDVLGAFTTLAQGDDPLRSGQQLRDFAELAARLPGRGDRRFLLHAANSSALGAGLGSHLDLVRPGIALYGVGAGRLAGRLRPVLSLRSEVLQVKTLEKGAPVGYQGSFVCARSTRLATLPIGYDDGLRRALSNRGELLVGGRKAPIVGAISMDLTTIDVTDIPGVRVGSPVVVIGRQGRASLSVAELAARAGTIPYEILCGVGRRVTREWKV